MRRLIFFWFLFSTLLLLVLSFLVAAWNGPVVLRAVTRYYVSDLVAYAADAALAEYERGGAKALDRFLQRVNFKGHTVVRVVDEAGRELRGLELTSDLENAAKRRAPDGEVDFQRGWRGVQATYPATGPSGRRYRFLLFFPARDIARELVAWPAWGIRLAVLLLVIVGLCSWLARHLTAPLGRLLTATRRFAGADLSARAGHGFAGAVPEIRELASGFDDMAGRIEALVANQQLLLQQMSHELRTPLTRLGLSVNMARSTAGAAAQPALTRIEQEAERLNALIERILRLSRLQSSRELPTLEPIDLSDFLEGIVADAEFEANARGRSIQLLHADGGKIRGDRDLLRGALENVLRNAIRYAPVGTEIEVTQRAVPTGGHAIVIRDYGIGVPQERLAEIFEPFVRVPGELPAHENAGFGLGLSIVKRSVDLHGGKVEARNAEGGGLAVELWLPAGLPPATERKKGR